VSRRTRWILLCALGAGALVAAGCGAVARVTSGDPTHGKALFVQKCGACHTMANAKTQGTVGPNLDNAFASDKEQGFNLSTITDLVRGQIAYPDTKPSTGVPGMTPNLAHGQDAKDIAVYVGLCTAQPNCKIPPGTVKVPSRGRTETTEGS
jgi:mono/diheme cytochrome c family protein